MLSHKDLTHLCFMADALVSDPRRSREFLRSLQDESERAASKVISAALQALDTSIKEVTPEGKAPTLAQLTQAADRLYNDATSAAGRLAGQALRWATENRARMEQQRDSVSRATSPAMVASSHS